jgi:thioredoxin reductase (NADPH)
VKTNDISSNSYDTVIVGAGPIGLACGVEAQKRGLNYLILEKGCLVNSIFHYPANMTFFSTSDRLEIGGVPFASYRDKPTRREALEYFRRVKTSWGLKVNNYERVEDIGNHGGRFTVRTGRGTYETSTVIIATGFYDTPNRMNVPGEGLSKVRHYFSEGHPFADQKVVVVGGGNSAVDAALETFRRGAEVTLVVREPALKKEVKYWVRPDLENRIAEGSIAALFKAELERIHEDRVDIRTPNGTVTIANDFVLAMTGYRPDYGILKNTGIEIGSAPQSLPRFDPDTHETNVAGIYLAGVICGGMDTAVWSIENSRFHPEKIFSHLLGRLNREGGRPQSAEDE